MSIGGRGSASYAIALTYNSKVWSAHHEQDDGNPDPSFGYPPFDHWSAEYDDTWMGVPGIHGGGSGWRLSMGPSLRKQTVEIEPVPMTECHQINCGYRYVLTRMWLVMSDGSEIELRDNLADGAPAVTPDNGYGQHTSNDIDRGRVWHASDGSGITYVADESFYLVNGGWVFYSDGTRMRMSIGGICSQIIDRNGNFITFDSTGYTDELGRQVTVAATDTTTTITAKGYNGVPDRSFTVDMAMIGALDGSGVPTNLRSDFRSLQRPFYSGDYLRVRDQGDQEHTDVSPHTDLFNGSENPDPIDLHMALMALHLPDGRSFGFRYNQYGELAEIIYPGGGISQIDYAGSVSGLCEGGPLMLRGTLNRRVTQRRSLTDAVNVDAVTMYSQDSVLLGGVYYPTVSVQTRQGSVTGALLASETHYFLALNYDYRNCAGTNGDGTGYTRWQNAKEFQVDKQTGSGTITVKRTWAQRAPVVWANNSYVLSRGQEQPDNDPRITAEDTILDNGKIKRVTYDYDNFNNVIVQKEYDFGGTDGSLGALIRQTFRTYGANIGSNYGNSINGYCYSNLNPADSSCGGGLASDVTSIIYQRGVLLNQTIKDGSGNQKAYAEFEYDNYSSATNHAALVTNSGMIQYDGTQFSSFASASQPRGNVTKITRWLSGGTDVVAYRKYDNAGHVIWTKDPKGNVTTVSYADSFGDGTNPDSGSAGTNGATFALATLATNAMNHQAKSQFDYTLGVTTGVKDANGVISKVEYDLIGRPLRVTAALGLSAQTIAETTYPTATMKVATASKQLDATRWLASKTELDGFDRVITSWQAEDGQHANSANFTIRANTIYDALGRVKQVSNPYRPAQGESAVYTTTEYDLAGRVTSVTTPDNAVVTSSYNGNEVTVTDQAGKQRKSITDGLSRLKEVYEDPNQNGLNYLTSYSYDVLDDLTTVSQGSQTRTFVYDSLKRLTSATNPESGTIGYQYDNSGNLTQKTDARGVVSSYVYDALNRNTSVTYTNDPANTPTITRTYDLATNGKGRLYQSQTSGASGFLTTIDSYDALGRPPTERQQFYVSGAWSQSFTTQRSYNLAGGVISQTNPSGHTIAYAYDNAGRTSSFTGNLGDGVTRTYASGITYSPFGGMTREQFGTDTPLYHKSLYNIRGQMFDTRLSSVNDTWDWNRGRLILYYSSNHTWGQSGTDNNGNVMFAENWVPPPNATLDQAESLITDTYSYDSLNRLTAVNESSLNIAGGGSWTPQFGQDYTYDRYGNRTINTGATWGGVNNKAFSVDTANNRLGVPSGQSGVMTYDDAGNLTTDTYSGSGVTRAYDAENRMTSETQANTYLAGSYTYNADGQRVRRRVGNIEMWQIYGFDGELLAEYAANTTPASPQKEYGYRNGQLLITAEARTNFALAANGATATASSTYSGYPLTADQAINGDRKGLNWPNGGGWHSSTATFPQWLQVDFNGSKNISEIDVFSVQDNPGSPVEPTESMTFSLYGLTGFDVQYWDGSAWTTVPDGSITGNNKVWRKIAFSPLTTSKIRVLTNASADGWSRITELEAWGNAAGPATNVTLSSNGATASASSTYSGYPLTADQAINGDRKGLNWPNGGGWHSSTATFPQWLQVDFNGSKTISEIDVFSVQDNPGSPVEPTESMTFSLYGLTGFDVQYWDGSAWTTVPGGSITGNNKVWRKITFSAITTSKIRVLTNASVDGWSRITEVEAWGTAAGSGGGTSANIQWLVTDQLGTPRMVFDQTGSLATMKRHDYLPFGEELGAGQGLRTTAQGYVADNVRQKFTLKERDNETGLDYFGARYYASTQGRFTGADDFLMDTSAIDPASWNLYVYVRNNPLRYIDPTGEKVYVGGLSQADRDELLRRTNYTYGCSSCVTVDKNGYLQVDTSGLSKDILKATQYLTDAINTTSWYGEVRVSNNDSSVAFGEGRPVRGSVPFEDGRKGRRNADLIVLDFGDDQWVSGDSRARDAFLNTVFAHEVAHFRLQPGKITEDPEDGSKTGRVVDAVNEILYARGLTLRARYASSAQGGYWLEIPHGIAEREGTLRNRDGGIKVKINETGNVIRWLKRNVGGKGIN